MAKYTVQVSLFHLSSSGFKLNTTGLQKSNFANSLAFRDRVAVSRAHATGFHLRNLALGKLSNKTFEIYS